MKVYKEEKSYWYDGGSGYGSHVQPLQFIFEHIKSKNALECGMGDYSTPLLLDNVEKLTSVEMQELDWHEKTKDKYLSDRWTCLLNLSDDLPKDVLDQDFDFVLSDGAAYSRPAIVNHFMQKGTETLVGHDTESTWYGWHHVREDLGYFKYQFTDIAPYTTVWTKNENLIQAIKKRIESKEKIVYIMQSYGIGDIIFCQSLANDFIKQGYKVLWGVEPHFLSIQKNFPNVIFVDKNIMRIDYNRRDVQETGNMIIYPLRWTDSICEVPYKHCMKSKYIYFGKAWQNWRNIEVVRDTKKENELYYDILKLTDGEEYNLVWDNFGSHNQFKTNIVLNNGLKTINVSIINGFSILDWSKVVENATNIHAVSSSNIYLFELLNIKADEINLYIRRPIEYNHENYSYILEKHKYNLHD